MDGDGAPCNIRQAEMFDSNEYVGHAPARFQGRGFCSAVATYQTNRQGSEIHEKGIRRRSVPNRHPTSGEPNPLSRSAQDMPHVPLERLEPDSDGTVTPSCEKSSVSDEKSPENTKKSTAKRTEEKKQSAQTGETGAGERSETGETDVPADDPGGGGMSAKRHATTPAEAEARLKTVLEEFNDGPAGAKLSSNSIGCFQTRLRNKSDASGFSNQEHSEASADIVLFENAVPAENREDREGDPNVRSIKRHVAPFYTADGFAETYITLKESPQAGHRIHSPEPDELKKPTSVFREWSLVNPHALTPEPSPVLSRIRPSSTRNREAAYRLLAKTEKARALFEKCPGKPRRRGAGDSRRQDGRRRGALQEQDGRRPRPERQAQRRAGTAPAGQDSASEQRKNPNLDDPTADQSR